MEIERKYLVLHLPGPLESYPCRILEQGYLNTSPGSDVITIVMNSLINQPVS